MYCANCGSQVLAEHVFCSKCGYRLSSAGAPNAAQSAPVAVPSARLTGAGGAGTSRIAQHLHVMAILWIVFSLLRLIPGLAMLAFAHTHFPFVLFPIPSPMRAFLTPMLGMVGLLVSGFAIAGVIAGWGLMCRQSWARALTIILAIISLLHFPLGTALGVYTLWVLMPQGAEQEYYRLAGNH